MSAVLNVVLPVFGIIAAGYICGRVGLLGAESSEALNRFVYYVALPALFFISLARVDFAGAPLGPFLTAFFGPILATFGLSILVALVIFPNRLGELGLHGLTAIFSNTGFIGIPLLVTAFGQEALLPGVLSTVLNGAVVIAAGTVVLEIDKGEGVGFLRVTRNALIGVAKSPLVLSAAAGLVVNLLDWPLPLPLETFTDILAAAVGPCALFAMGLFIVGRSVTRGAGEVGWLVMLKLVVQPAIAWWLAFDVLHMQPVWAASAVILSALPVGALVFILAHQYGVFVQRSTAAILVSTVLSAVTLSLLLALLGVT